MHAPHETVSLLFCLTEKVVEQNPSVSHSTLGNKGEEIITATHTTYTHTTYNIHIHIHIHIHHMDSLLNMATKSLMIDMLVPCPNGRWAG